MKRRSVGCKRNRLPSTGKHILRNKKQFATTFCELGNRRFFGIVAGKSASDLQGFLPRLRGREKVKMVCIAPCSAFRSLVRRYFPNAILVVDRFHVVRVVSHQLSSLPGILRLLRSFGGASAEHRRTVAQGVKKLTSADRERLETVFTPFGARGCTRGSARVSLLAQ